MRRGHPIRIAYLALLTCAASRPLEAQEPTVFATVFTTKAYVVGGGNPTTGLFYRSASSADTLWLHTGPANIRAFGLSVHPTRENLLAIGAGNGLHRTSDGGLSWKITTGWEISEILTVAMDTEHPERIYCGTPYGVFRTEDSGATWKLSSRGLSSLFVSSLVIDRRNPSHLYAGTEGGVFASPDRGASWKKTSLRVQGIRTIAQSPANPEMLMAGTEDDGLWLSLDGGKKWQKCTRGIEHSTFYTIAFDHVNPARVYAGGFETGIYKSTDAGRTWQHIQATASPLTVHSIAVDPGNPSRLFAGTLGSGVFRSEDAGLTWKYAGLTGSQVWSIAVRTRSER